MKIRKAIFEDAEGIAQVHVRSWQTTYKGIISESYLKQLNPEARKKNWERNIQTVYSAVYVAEDDEGNIVGFASGGPEQTKNPKYYSTGEIYAVYLLDTHQRQGLGTQLIARILGHLQTLKLEQLFIWALKDNPACRFYEALGGDVIEEQQIEIGGSLLTEVGYGWDSIDVLYQQLT